MPVYENASCVRNSEGLKKKKKKKRIFTDTTRPLCNSSVNRYKPVALLFHLDPCDLFSFPLGSFFFSWVRFGVGLGYLITDRCWLYVALDNVNTLVIMKTCHVLFTVTWLQLYCAAIYSIHVSDASKSDNQIFLWIINKNFNTYVVSGDYSRELKYISDS